MDDRQAFLAQIEADPLNHLLRCVFADWLDERGESDEADRQRRWAGAYQYLYKNFVDVYGDYGDAEPPSYTTAMQEFDYWQRSLVGDGEICFGDTEPPEKLDDEPVREEFFRCLEVVTGVKVLPETRKRASFVCAC